MVDRDRCALPRAGGLLSILVAVGVIAGAVPGQSDADCAAVYKSYVDELNRKDISPQQRAALHRWARRVYDACETGDVDNPRYLFERLDRNHY
jgi:hypothetical protein